MKKIYLTLLMVKLCAFVTLQAQVGVGTTTPDAFLDLENTSTSDNTLQINARGTTNTSSAQWLRNYGLGRGINLQTLNTSNDLPALDISQIGTGSFARGASIEMDAASTAVGLIVFQDGTGDAIYTSNSDSGWGINNYISGSGSGVFNNIQGTGGYGVYTSLTHHGGTGEYINYNDQNGVGVRVVGVDDTSTPTTGGDVFGFWSDVYTDTASSGDVFYGAAFVGFQYGIGRGIDIEHSGTEGECAEFTITDTNNNDSVLNLITEGGGSAINASNDDDSITGTLVVADFSYTGSDVDDHIAVRGISAPATNYGYGVYGQGSFYGVFSNGDQGATGTKTFLIDHPSDPANKFLRHYSIESDEILNMYRGTETFNAEGKAIVQLPDYYDVVNTNPSYQLTPIGAAMNLYIEREIEQGVFVIAGGVANKKVSWIITAERNDPYIKQNPHLKEPVFNKEGERSGKYLTPELYDQPKSKGLFYNKNDEKPKTSSTPYRPKKSKELEKRIEKKNDNEGEKVEEER